MLHASALTYYTLMSIVPVLAISFGIAKGFGLEALLEQQVRNSIQINQEVVERGVEFAKRLLANTQGSVIASVGVLVLFWSAIKLLSNIEEAFNDIWRVDKQRPFAQKVSHYLSFVFLMPLLLVLSGSLTVFIANKITDVLEGLSFLGFLSPIVAFGLRLAPVALIWILFTFTYAFLPNTRVSFRSALMAGFLFGTVCVGVQEVYIGLQVGVTRLNAIYGSFAALPLFLTWLHITWSVVLLGAEYCYCFQHTESCTWRKWIKRPSLAYQRLLSLAVVRACIDQFCANGPALSLEDIATRVGAPAAIVESCVEQLTEAGILSQVVGDGMNVCGYQPARSVETLTIATVLEALESIGDDDPSFLKGEIAARFSEHLKKLREAWASHPANARIKDV